MRKKMNDSDESDLRILISDKGWFWQRMNEEYTQKQKRLDAALEMSCEEIVDLQDKLEVAERAVYDCAFNQARYAQPCDRCPATESVLTDTKKALVAAKALLAAHDRYCTVTQMDFYWQQLRAALAASSSEHKEGR
jgi:hypothetical protein